MNHRALRVGALIHEELAKIIVREIEFSPGALVTITGVEVSPKLENAKVMVGVLPASFSAGVLALLGKEAGHLQYLLLKKINIKPMPRIHFELDHGPENAAKVEKQFLDGA